MNTTEASHVVTLAALGILGVIETVCLPSTLLLLCLFREDRMAKLYPQESIRIGAAGSYILDCFLVLLHIPLCIVLLGWHAVLDGHPLACFSLCILATTLCMCIQCNMLYMSIHFAFTIIRPLRVNALFTRRRGVIGYVITVYVVPVVAGIIWTASVLTLTPDFFDEHIVCLAFPIYCPLWLLQATTFGFVIPLTSVSFILNSYLIFIAKKQARRTVHVQIDQQVQPTAEIQINNEDVHTGSRDIETQSSESDNSRTWKGTRLMYMAISVAFFFLIPTYSITGTISICRKCLPEEIAFVLLLTVFSVTALWPVFYNYSNPRVREMIKNDMLMFWTRSSQISIRYLSE